MEKEERENIPLGFGGESGGGAVHVLGLSIHSAAFGGTGNELYKRGVWRARGRYVWRSGHVEGCYSATVTFVFELTRKF